MKGFHSKGFSERITCLVINLDSRPDRWQRMRFLCSFQGIEPNRFRAHDGDEGSLRYPRSPLSPAELGLWSSFTAAIKSPVETEWILVLEDDSLLLPRFRKQALKEIRRASDQVTSIRMGWMGPIAWHSHMTLSRYLQMMPRMLLGELRHRARRRFSSRGDVELRAIWGTHVLLIRRARLDQLLLKLGEATLPLDEAFTSAEWTEPVHFVRARRNRAWQWPDRSDIRDGRVARQFGTRLSEELQQ